MVKAFFLATKPLQYFNITNIADGSSEKICLLIDLFYNAEEFYNSVKIQPYWDQVLFFKTSIEAYEWLQKKVSREDLLYIDSDYGVKKTLWLSKIKSKNIFVYEEGTGSYRDDLITISKSNRFIKFLLKQIGFKEHMGGGKYTKGIIIYDLEKHSKLVPNYKKNRTTFRTGFMEHLPVVKEHFNYQNDLIKDLIEKLRFKKVILYLTSWQYNMEVESVLKEYPEHISIIKPHPHIQLEFTETPFVHILKNGIFVENFINSALEDCTELIVVHENSSAMQYISSNKIVHIYL